MSDDQPRDEAATAAAGQVLVDRGQTGEPDPATEIDPKAIVRLARLHLRMGLYTLARAELEAIRGLASLDDDGLEGLAEACWRTGDLAAAGRVAVPMAQAGRGDRSCW